MREAHAPGRRPTRRRSVGQRILIVLGIAAAQLALAALVVRFGFGLWIGYGGAGRPRLVKIENAAERAAIVREHREAQRLAAALALTTPDPAVIAGELPENEEALGPAPPAAAAPAPAALQPWADFRGALRDGRYRGPSIRTEWPPSGLVPMWKQPVGGGYASFVVASNLAFTIEQRGPEEVVAAYDVQTGFERWTHGWTALFQEWMGGDGPRATPTWSDGRLYALGATGELRALEANTGELIWRVDILQDNGASNLDWGMAAAPLVVDDAVIVVPGGRGGRSVVAYDRNTGERLWSALDDRASYASPMQVTLAGEPQLLVFTASRLVGLSLTGDRVLWSYPWSTPNDINAAQPLVVGNARVFVSSSYGTGAAVIEIARSGDGYRAIELWKNIRMKNRFTSSVFYDGFIYGLDENILACLNAETGELMWKGGRYGYGQVLLADGRLIVLTEDGDLVLVRATPERHDEMTRFGALEGKTWNHPAMANGILLVRNLREMAAFDLR